MLIRIGTDKNFDDFEKVKDKVVKAIETGKKAYVIGDIQLME